MSGIETVERVPRKFFLPALVVKNAVALCGVQIGRKLIPLASIPYLARVLGPEGWGQVAFITAMAELVAMVIEFGFTFSATRSIARYRDDPVQRGKITTGVLSAQVLLATFAITSVLIASRFIPVLRANALLVFCGVIYSLAQGFSPLWYFQGMERIRLAAALEIGAKVAALGALFVFVKEPHHVWRALAIQAMSPSTFALVGIPLALSTSVPCRPQWRVVKAVLNEGWNMFVFRSTESLYGVANVFLLGLFAPPAAVGYFGAAEKISKATAGLVHPIRESLYPRINHLMHQDSSEALRLARIGTGIMVGSGVLFSGMLLLFARPIMTLLMGHGFDAATSVLQILSPLPLTLAVTFASGSLWLLPMRKDRIILHAVSRAALVNVGLSFLLAPTWGQTGMASAVLVSETVVACSLLWNVIELSGGNLIPRVLSPTV